MAIHRQPDAQPVRVRDDGEETGCSAGVIEVVDDGCPEVERRGGEGLGPRLADRRVDDGALRGRGAAVRRTVLARFPRGRRNDIVRQRTLAGSNREWRQRIYGQFMARIRSLKEAVTENPRLHPTEVDCTWQTTRTDDGEASVTLSTYGSEHRVGRPKVSQTLQLGRRDGEGNSPRVDRGVL